LSLAEENRLFQHLDDGRVEILQSELFGGLDGRCYDLIVSNPPYVGRVEFESLPEEFQREPGLGLVSGEDGLDLVLRMLAEAPEFLSEQGLLIVEVGASEPVLIDTLPQVPFVWIEFESGPMGVFAIERRDLIAHAEIIARAADGR
ncbi:MAG: 50S ribosomal protein L3 N(5)-glutamine methyltransferase, partial [Rhodanobacteraceae bacterium]